MDSSIPQCCWAVWDPVNMPITPAGKLFAGFFALYAGLLFIAITARC